MRTFIRKNAVVKARRCVDFSREPYIQCVEGQWRLLTPEGWRTVQEGDWIVMDETGAMWPMADDVFMLLYESHDEKV
ncbi:hypothetical protein WS50_11860 [Burkholderia territorii]|uniref:hypothetical protein n=1 Tax=Burkholderia territorii TaxID=1503055 RepID=UPI00075EB174|nr:hypothetical protein [Burkholderia territorii]KUY98151.1 hypothetical protein WS47_05865 [Burkholderia territorii]KUZ17989.1 hypothetical protein WS50_11860 [Burkholderia territorii]